VEAPNPKRLKRAGMDPDVSPCAVCGNEVSSNYKCVGACGRNLHHFGGKGFSAALDPGLLLLLYPYVQVIIL
jgi:hypothetical protein